MNLATCMIHCHGIMHESLCAYGGRCVAPKPLGCVQQQPCVAKAYVPKSLWCAPVATLRMKDVASGGLGSSAALVGTQTLDYLCETLAESGGLGSLAAA